MAGLRLTHERSSVHVIVTLFIICYAFILTRRHLYGILIDIWCVLQPALRERVLKQSYCVLHMSRHCKDCAECGSALRWPLVVGRRELERRPKPQAWGARWCSPSLPPLRILIEHLGTSALARDRIGRIATGASDECSAHDRDSESGPPKTTAGRRHSY